MKKVFFLFVILAFVSCQSGSKKVESENSTESIEVVEATLNISGMHCNNCVASVEKGINEVEGITALKVSLNDSNAVVKFDASKTDLTEIKKAIEKRGYSIVE